MEKLICRALKLQPLRIDSRKYVCFDAINTTSGRPVEIKSVHAGSRIPIYDWRMDKESEYIEELDYAIGIHKIKEAKSYKEWWDQVEVKGIELVFTTAKLIHKLAHGEPLRSNTPSANDTSGYRREGYKNGYRELAVELIKDGMMSYHSRIVQVYNREVPVMLTMHEF